MTLPIHDIRRSILETLEASNRLVLGAPTGSGKTTQVPQFLLQSGLLRPPHEQIVVLQPRRLAARMVAERIARELNSPIGERVGYQTRHESRVGPRTVIRFMTEGLFLRLLAGNRRLEGVGAVLLDEFHERNLATDTSVALLKRLQEAGRADLRLVVMSATMDVQRVSEYLGCPAIEAHGRAYPVEIGHYWRRPVARVGTISRLPGRSLVPPWDLAAEALDQVLQSGSPGDVLIFMPGVYEIRRTVEACQRLPSAGGISVFPLYSELTAREQDAALAPCPDRKVIVATNVAETSITIEGIRHVIDSGLARINRFDPRRGINVLAVEPISRASADQRAGRAGRTAPGTCVRLWPENEHRHRPAHSTPEIQRLDLAEVILQLFALDVEDPAMFPWLEPPSAAALEQAMATLHELEALQTTGGRAHLTETGRRMARLPMHPRLSRMLVEAGLRHCLERATLWAALISERDILTRGGSRPWVGELEKTFPQSDFLVLESALERARGVGWDAGRCDAMGIHASACREVERTVRIYQEACRASGLRGAAKALEASIESLAKCLLVAFPDHLAMRRNESNLACALTAGRGGQLEAESAAQHFGPVLPIEIRELGIGTGGQGVRIVLSLATELDLEWIREVWGGRVEHERTTVYRPETTSCETVQREVFEGLVLEERILGAPDREAAARLLAERVMSRELRLDHWDHAAEQWIERVRCVAEWFPERGMIRYDEDERRLILQEFCEGAVRYREIKDKPVLPYLKNALSWEDQQFVERMAPERFQLPGGWRMKIEYSAGAPPRARAKIQDLYGLNSAPLIAGGRVRLLLEILGPNMRPVQMTDDLENFWKNLYPQIRKELARRYPRHEWR